MGNTWGRMFRCTTWGESHGVSIGVVVDGCPAGLPIDIAEIQHDLDLRKPGRSSIASPRQEADCVTILSGIDGGFTMGVPIAMHVHNTNAQQHDYANISHVFRPSHADYTYHAKYGRRFVHGGGRASARETVARVAAGAIARKLLQHTCGIEILAYVYRIQTIKTNIDPQHVTRADIYNNPVRCPDAIARAAMLTHIETTKQAGDSLGGVIEAVMRGVPPGLGEPVFDKLEADLAKAMLSIPACRGFEIGAGFAGTKLTGAAHNDAFYHDGTRIRTRTNHAGGIQGGISNGEDIIIRVAFKPTSTIQQVQESVDHHGNAVSISAQGRHDPCVLPRAVPIVEAMCALTLADHYLMQRIQASLA